MVEITSVEMDWPEHLKWYLTQEGRDKMQSDMDKVACLIDLAQEITDRYGFDLNAVIEERE